MIFPLIAAASLLLQQTPPSDTAGGRACRVAIDSMGHYHELTDAEGRKTQHGGGGVLAHCAGTNTTLSADSFANYSALGRLDLIGRVQIRDTGMALDARFVSYYVRDERLVAHNNVVAVNRLTGSVLRGPNMTYWRAAPGIRDTTEMYATTRPTVEYRQAASDSAEPYIIVADRIRLKGDDRMWGGGKVTVDRSDFASRSDSMMLDQTQGFGVLVGTPSVEGRGRRGAADMGKSYTLVGRRIELGLEQRDIRLVKALGEGKATGADWTLTADTIHLAIADRMLQQTFAWGDSSRPNAVSTLYTIQSDSMAIDSPAEVLTESRSFGQALSTARRDSTTPLANMDWIAGDTLTARFAQEPDSANPTRNQSRLRQVLSWGAARALTHHLDAADSATAAQGPAINYSRGNRITVSMLRDRIERVIVAGKADGVHLEPRPAVVADSLRRVTPPPPAPPPIP